MDKKRKEKEKQMRMEDDRYQALQAFHRGGVESLENAYAMYGLVKTGTRPLQHDEKAAHTSHPNK